jgi:tripartite-type tricarboxylate transporter receptor subunit TctC
VRGLQISNWAALFGPKDTPSDIVDKLNRAVAEAQADPLLRKRLADLGLELFSREQQSPEALAAFHKAEVERWWPIIKAANIKTE